MTQPIVSYKWLDNHEDGVCSLWKIEIHPRHETDSVLGRVRKMRRSTYVAHKYHGTLKRIGSFKNQQLAREAVEKAMIGHVLEKVTIEERRARKK